MKRTFKLTPQDAAFVLKHIPNSQLKDQLEEFVEASQLFKRIEKLLIDNKRCPCCIPTIKELGELRGGYALVKEISAAGGLKSVRPLYARYLFNRSQKS